MSENAANIHGAGIASLNSNPVISDNTISENSVHFQGGGIYCSSSSPAINGNIIRRNSANKGAGAYFYSSPGEFELNDICQNIADYGGGLYLGYLGQELNNNTIAANTGISGGGVFCAFMSDVSVLNSILWNNAPLQIYQDPSSNLQVTYSDIQGSWPDIGNIDEYPAFVDTSLNDYRILWGSPCIDTGDPNPIYNDPDGTRADMGAYYYDQSMPVRILLTPREIPYLIPEEGGSMDYTIRATNIDSIPQDMTVWCDVTLPDSSIFGPLLGPVTVTLGAGSTVERIRMQIVPGGAPMGVYFYNAYAVVGADTSKDSFMFGKLGSAGGDRVSGWTNSGDPLQGPIATQTLLEHRPLDYSLGQNYPNPFNATTAISYQLSALGFVNLSVYNVSCRKVIELVNGWREAGRHEVTFDGSGFASGVYVYWLVVGEFEASGKMVLMK